MKKAKNKRKREKFGGKKNGRITKRELERVATDREKTRTRERVRGEEQSGGGSVGGPIVMNRWWGEEKVKPVSVGVAGTHPVLCGQMCGRAAS